MTNIALPLAAPCAIKRLALLLTMIGGFTCRLFPTIIKFSFVGLTYSWLIPCNFLCKFNCARGPRKSVLSLAAKLITSGLGRLTRDLILVIYDIFVKWWQVKIISTRKLKKNFFFRKQKKNLLENLMKW